MKRPRLNPRKLLIASAGVATVNYAFAAGCGGKEHGGGGAVVANLLPGPPYVAGFDPRDGGPAVANLVAPPPPLIPPGPADAAAPDAQAADAASSGDAALDGG